jgi:phosphoglycolate phosphatase-like HAD superfamily hydrolase
MHSFSQQTLKDLPKTKEFFIGIDSDGCVFDTMEIKHKECFCPNFIKHFGFQSVSKYARETWDFVNLYSSTRGCNRFIAILETVKWLSKRAEVKARNAEIPDMEPVKEWVKKESKLGNPALEKYLQTNNDPALKRAYKWSLAVNASVADMVYGIKPFPLVMDCLKIIQEKADAIVVSQTPYEALIREWKENTMEGFVSTIAGQEYGTKTEHIKYAASGKYDTDKILMIGDAPGDYKAAKLNNALFYPINPSKEEKSWARLYEEGLGKFFSGSFAGSYQQQLLDEFNALLPEKPHWK